MSKMLCLATIFCFSKVFGEDPQTKGTFVCQQSWGWKNTACTTNWAEYTKNNFPISETFTEDELINRNCKEANSTAEVKNYLCPPFWDCSEASVKNECGNSEVVCDGSKLPPDQTCSTDCTSFYTVICSGDSAWVLKVDEDYPLPTFSGCDTTVNLAQFCPRIIESHGKNYTYCECLN